MRVVRGDEVKFQREKFNNLPSCISKEVADDPTNPGMSFGVILPVVKLIVCVEITESPFLKIAVVGKFEGSSYRVKVISDIIPIGPVIPVGPILPVNPVSPVFPPPVGPVGPVVPLFELNPCNP